jgi:hypothetical protein
MSRRSSRPKRRRKRLTRPPNPLTQAAEWSERVLDAYRNAFSGFLDDEISILDGVILEPPSEH